MDMRDRPELGRLTTAGANRHLPVHRWLRYKEAFSRDLAWLLLDEVRAGKGMAVLDPFCGTGTTLLACKEKGIRSYGADLNPIALTTSRAKTMDYDLNGLGKERKAIFSERAEKAPMPEEAGCVKEFFDRETLDRLLFYRGLASKGGYRDFFLLALANAAYECSRVARDGAVLRPAKKMFIPLVAAFKRNVKGMERDIKKSKFPAVKAEVMEADARSIPLKDKSVDAVITSPPYLGIEDYTTAYAIENFTVGGKIKNWLGRGGSKEAYFGDMLAVLKELKRVCRPKARMAMVMWDGFLDGRIVDTCEMMSNISKRVGLNLEKIWVVNRKPALAERTRKVGMLRESVLFLQV
jgi:SAM-dependent methyltransferase